jgi:1,4-dihydroxy-2-naphthoate octaprenyltransferase
MEKEMKTEGKNEPIPVITGLVNWWYSMVVMLSITAMGGVIMFVYFYVQSAGFNNIIYLYVAFPAILLLTLVLWLNGFRKRVPERFLELIRYLKRNVV